MKKLSIISLFLFSILFSLNSFASCVYKYDWQTGNNYRVCTNSNSTTLYGNNYNTGSSWNQTSYSNGSYNGRDSNGNYYNGNNNTGYYFNSGTGKTCYGQGIYRRCYWDDSYETLSKFNLLIPVYVSEKSK